MTDQRLDRRSAVRQIIRVSAPFLAAAALLLVASLPAGAATERRRPPLPTVTSAGDTTRPLRGSYCWSYDSGGGRAAICADYADFPKPNSRRLDAEPGEVVEIDMHHPTDRLSASRRGLNPVVGSDRLYRFKVPKRAKRSFDLDLGARYPEGDGYFGLRVVVR